MKGNWFATAAVASICMLGCAADQGGSEDALITQTHEALSSASLPRDLVTLHAEAVFLPPYRAAIVDLALTPIPRPPTEADDYSLHSTGEFDVVLVYDVSANGRRQVLQTLTRKDFAGPNSIGPGGGCIHFFLPARVGDRLFIGGVVRLTGETRARLGVASLVTVSNQISGSLPNEWPFAALGDDHKLPPPP